MRSPVVPVLVVLSISAFALVPGCGDDALPDDPRGDTSAPQPTVDPAVLELHAVSSEVLGRARALGVSGDEFLALYDSADPRALAKRLGYSPAEEQELVDRMMRARDDLFERHPEVVEQARGADPCTDCEREAVAGVAKHLDAPVSSSELARQQIICDIPGLIGDLYGCMRASLWSTGCARRAICTNCDGAALDALCSF
jgi:hypothetical protein